MKKIGLIILSLILALGAMGVGYAMWTDTVVIKGDIDTGTVDVELSCYPTNDEPPHGTPGNNSSYFSGNLDPSGLGIPPNPGTWDLGTKTWTGPRVEKNVASTDCALSVGSGSEPNDTLTITIDNAYPFYLGSVLYDVHNVGTIPVELVQFVLGKVSISTKTPPGIPVGKVFNYPTDFNKWWHVQISDTYVVTISETHSNALDDFAFYLSDNQFHGVWNQIEPSEYMLGDITIILEEAALQDVTYDFEFALKYANFNEVD